MLNIISRCKAPFRTMPFPNIISEAFLMCSVLLCVFEYSIACQLVFGMRDTSGPSRDLGPCQLKMQADAKHLSYFFPLNYQMWAAGAPVTCCKLSPYNDCFAPPLII